MEDEPIALGWRERVRFPELGNARITCKVDTGAHSSSLHATEIETWQQQSRTMVRFNIHPHRKKPEIFFTCNAQVADQRVVSNSGGQLENRIVILTPVKIGPHLFNIEINLTNRDTMRYRMLLGRTSMNGRFIVDPSRSFLLGKNPQ